MVDPTSGSRVIDLCTPSPSPPRLPSPPLSPLARPAVASTAPGSARPHLLSGSYARALSPDSTPPPPVSRPIHFIEAASGHGAIPSGSRHSRLSAEHIGRIFRPTTSTGPNTSIEAPPTGRSTPHHRPRGEVRNPADWLRADDISPETSPERDVPCASVLGLSMIAAGTLDPAGRAAQNHDDQTPAQAKRARPTWVTRTPTPPLAIRFPHTPPITPAQGDLIATGTAARTNHPTAAEAQATGQEQSGELEDEVDADDEMSEDEDVGCLKWYADKAGGEGAGERSDEVQSCRAASECPGDHGEPGTRNGASGGTTVGVKWVDPSTSCADFTLQALVGDVDCIATHHKSSSAPS